MNLKKNIFWSKTFWFNVIMIIASTVEGAEDLIKESPQYVSAFWAIVNMILRKVSNKELTILKNV